MVSEIVLAGGQARSAIFLHAYVESDTRLDSVGRTKKKNTHSSSGSMRSQHVIGHDRLHQNPLAVVFG